MSAPLTAEEIARLRALCERRGRTTTREDRIAAIEAASRLAAAAPRLLDTLETSQAEVTRLRAEVERSRSLSLVSDEPSVGDRYTNGAIVKQIVSYSPEDDHFMWHDGKRISRSVLMSDPMWRKL